MSCPYVTAVTFKEFISIVQWAILQQCFILNKTRISNNVATTTINVGRNIKINKSTNDFFNAGPVMPDW